MTTTICYFFSFLVEAVILWQYASFSFVPRLRTKTRLILLCILYSILFAVSLYDKKWLNALLYFLVSFTFMEVGYRLKWLSAFFHSAVLTAVMAMCELAMYGVVEHFFTESASSYNIIFFAIFSKMTFLLSSMS